MGNPADADVPFRPASRRVDLGGEPRRCLRRGARCRMVALTEAITSMNRGLGVRHSTGATSRRNAPRHENSWGVLPTLRPVGRRSRWVGEVRSHGRITGPLGGLAPHPPAAQGATDGPSYVSEQALGYGEGPAHHGPFALTRLVGVPATPMLVSLAKGRPPSPGTPLPPRSSGPADTHPLVAMS
jgi:hypothetical protein